MDEVIALVASSIVTLLTFFTQRLVKGIDDKFASLEMKFNNLSRETKIEVDKFQSSIEELKRYNATIQAQLVDKNMRHAEKIIKAVDRLKDEQTDQKLDHAKVYGRVIHLEAKHMDNKNAIAIQQKKMDILHDKLIKK